jgi:hypothetical protein
VRTIIFAATSIVSTGVASVVLSTNDLWGLAIGLFAYSLAGVYCITSDYKEATGGLK